MAQQALRRQHDQRQRIGGEPQRLPAQQVEVLRRGRGVGDLDVVLGAEREEPLDAGARVLGTLAFVPVRQQQDQAR